MNDETKKVYEEFISSYKELSTTEKRNEIISELKKIIALLSKVNTDIGINNNLILNKEIIEAIETNASEDDYLEGIYVFINCLEELFGNYLEHTTKNIYE